MPTSLPLDECARLYAIERTGLSAAVVDEVIDAIGEFWRTRFPDVMDAAAQLVAGAEEER